MLQICKSLAAPHLPLPLPRPQMVKENEKARSLQQELSALNDDQRVIVFANTKRQVGGRVGWAADGLCCGFC